MGCDAGGEGGGAGVADPIVAAKRAGRGGDEGRRKGGGGVIGEMTGGSEGKEGRGGKGGWKSNVRCRAGGGQWVVHACACIKFIIAVIKFRSFEWYC